MPGTELPERKRDINVYPTFSGCGESTGRGADEGSAYMTVLGNDMFQNMKFWTRDFGGCVWSLIAGVSTSIVALW
jgi:hypothetical protein